MSQKNGEEIVEIMLNYQGEDVIACVDVNTANVLFNDADEADKYAANFLQQSQTNDTVQVTTSSTLVWCGKKPINGDLEATRVFLDLRRKYSTQFDDNKTVKTQIWTKIAQEMKEYGYNVGQDREAVEKLRQKFSNLQKQYLKYLSHVKRTGEENRDPPPFFSEVHDILGGKDKSNPQHLQDTEEQTESEACKDNKNENQAVAEAKVINRFSLINNKNTKPHTTNKQLIDLMKQQHEEDKLERQQQFDRLEKLLSQQNQQRERLLNQFDTLIKLSKKRRLDSDDSE